MAKSREQRLIEQLLQREEKAIQEAFLTFLQDTRSNAVLRAVREALETRDTDAALRIADSYVARLGNVIPQVFQNIGISEGARLYQALGAQFPRVAITFDPAHTRAAALMRQNALSFVREFTQQQRATTQRALTQAFLDGAGPREAAQAFRDSIGLTTSQWDAVANYRRLLEEGSAEALSREYRDRRYDRTVDRAVREGEPLSRTQVNTMVDRYQDRMLAARAETIARTESLRMVNQAREEALNQVIEQTGMARDRITRVWRATNDARTRDTHAAMDGQERGIDEPFESPSGALIMYPGDPSAPPEETINCRCVVLTEIAPPEN